MFLATSMAISTLAYASSWVDSFYTDESSYYIKLSRTSFTQRFRLDRQHCDALDARIILRKDYLNDKNNRNMVKGVSFSKMSSSRLSSWPTLFGIDAADYCWYQATVSGLDLNSPQENDYIIQLNDSHQTIFLAGHRDSLLIRKRLVSKNVAVNNWIDFAATGATPVSGGGVYFKIWEPTSERVDLFLNLSSDHISMKRSSDGRYHVRYVSSASVGDSYHFKFVKNGKYESLEVGNNDRYSSIKVDPMAKKISYQAKGGRYNGYVRPQAVVTELPPLKSWSNDSKIQNILNSDWNNWIIYQLWPLTFNPMKQWNEYQGGTFNDIHQKIDYLVDLGINTVEFLPVGESRFKATWGYALDSLTAIETTLGTPEDLKRIIEALHSRGIRVIFDIVINHVNNDLIRDPLTEHNQRSKYFGGNTVWGPKPDYKKIEVRRWIMDSLLSLMRDYHVDGFRFDMTANIYGDGPYNTFNADGYQLLQEINQTLMQNSPSFFSVAEELPDNVWITKPVRSEGAGFDSQWNDKFKNFFEKSFNNYRDNRRWVDLYPLQSSMQGYSNHSHYGNDQLFGKPYQSLNYLGSHDFIGNKNPILRIVSDYMGEESDAHNQFYRVRPLEDPYNTHDNFRLIHNDFTHSVARLCYGILFTKPGPLLFYQGEEIGQDINIENEWSYVAARRNNTEPTKDVDIDRYVGSHRMPWEYHNPGTRGDLSFLSESERKLFWGQRYFFQDMIAFRKAYSGINDSHAYNVRVDSGNSLITYQIKGDEKEFFVIANFGDSHDSFWVDFPRPKRGSWWKERVNSSSITYGGESDRYNNVISNVIGRKNMIRLGGSTMMLFQANSAPEISKTLYLMSDLNGWQAKENHKLKCATSDECYVDFRVTNSGQHQFKLATSNWHVEMGIASDEFFSYAPGASNVDQYLRAGKYRMIFNAKTFGYKFIKRSKTL